jgi:ABC-type lipoprotein release transport system permease subunit
VFIGITNYRKTQQRDIFWRRFQYSAFGVITLGVIILIIILSMTNKRPMPSTQVIDIKHSNQVLPNKNITSTSRRKRETFNGLLSLKSKHFFFI